MQVVGFQWNWVFNYIDDDVHEVGSPTQLPTLYLVQGETVRFKLKLPDVIHSFWVPSFWYKKDVIPGRTNEFEIDPTKLGTFAGRCAELCGLNHSGMLFWVKVVTPRRVPGPHPSSPGRRADRPQRVGQGAHGRLPATSKAGPRSEAARDHPR